MLAGLALYLFLFAHDIHLSMMEVEYVAERQALQITESIFLDDLDFTFEDLGFGKQFLCTEMETDTAEAVLHAYMSERLSFSINGEPVLWEFIGKEISPDLASVYVHIYIPNVGTLESLTIENSVLFEKYDDQKTIVHIKGPNRKKDYLVLHSRERSGTITYKP